MFSRRSKSWDRDWGPRSLAVRWSRRDREGAGEGHRDGRETSQRCSCWACFHRGRLGLSHRRSSEKLCRTRLRPVPPKGREAGVFVQQLPSLHGRVAPKPFIFCDFYPATKREPSALGQITPSGRETQEALGYIGIVCRWPSGGSRVCRLKVTCKR